MTPEALEMSKKYAARVMELEKQVAAQQAQMYEDRRQALVWRDQVAASQEREAKLLEALTMIRKGCNQRDPAAVIAKEAIALPTDDSALMERLKEERERICGLYSPDDTASDFMDKIRGLA